MFHKFILYVDLRAIHELFILFAMQFLFLGFFPIWPAHFFKLYFGKYYIYLFILFIERQQRLMCINRKKFEIVTNLFGEIETKRVGCEGCEKDIIHKHNGIKCFIKDWANKDSETGKTGRKIKFIDLLKNNRK